MTRRISPFTDFGFKYLFGQEDNKDLLIDFLNILLADEPGFEKMLHLLRQVFIVEMQNAYQDYFINRSIYYASRSIVKQGRAVYNIKNMENMSSIAFTQQHRIFKRLDSVTNYYNLTDEQRNAYDEDLKIYRDFQNCMASSERRGEIKGFEKGMEKGMEKGQAQIIRQLVENGMSRQTIADNLQMSLSDIRRIIGEI